MVSNKIVNLANPTNDQDAATKKYVDTAAAVGSAAQTTANALVVATTNNTATAAAQYLYPANNQGAGILTNGTYRLYVTPNGEIGIGPTNTSPSSLLDVRGNIYCSHRIGIGTASPSCPLHVAGSATINPAGTGYYLNQNGGSALSGAFNTDISIITEKSILIRGTHLWITSDQRIKTNIVNLNADKMMNIFRHLRPISFDFIDPMKNYNKKHFGFIAQEVNEFLPEGISLNKDVIPNNMMKADVAKPSETDEPQCFTLKPDDTDITLQYLLLTTDSPLKIDTANPYSSKDIYKFKIYGGDKWAKEQDIYIRSDYNVIDDKYTYVIGLKKEAYDVVITESTLFVYGQYVNDLHILDHDTIYTVATAALQEVDKQQQADKGRIAELEATVATQQSLINDILERLKTLERE